MKPETQKILDDYNAIFHPGVEDRPYIDHPRVVEARTAPFTTDPLHAASAADERRQCDELRGLVREAASIIGEYYNAEMDHSSVGDWLRRARSAAL
jgi:hypothetical protein